MGITIIFDNLNKRFFVITRPHSGHSKGRAPMWTAWMCLWRLLFADST